MACDLAGFVADLRRDRLREEPAVSRSAHVGAATEEHDA